MQRYGCDEALKWQKRKKKQKNLIKYWKHLCTALFVHFIESLFACEIQGNVRFKLESMLFSATKFDYLSLNSTIASCTRVYVAKSITRCS